MSYGSAGAFSGYSVHPSARRAVRLILDQLSVSARAAYSFRLMRAAYTGPLIRLRRSSDNVESDFSPTANGFLDSAAIITWAGSGNSAYCTTIYDQTGNGYHATQTTNADQPDVVSAGTWRGGVHSAVFSQVMLIPAGATSSLTAASVSAVASRISTHPGYYKIGSAGNDTHHPFSDNNIYSDFFASTRISVSGATLPAVDVKSLITETNDGTTLTIYQKNVSRGSATITFASPSTRKFPGSSTNGRACGNELVLFASALSSGDRNTLTTEQISAWSIP